MPHVVLEGPVSLEDFFHSFEALSVRQDESIMKIKDALFNIAGSKILLECVVVEDHIPQSFYIAVTQKAGKTSVHLDAFTDPEKTDSIKRLLAIIAQKVKSQNASCRYGSHNLQGFLEDAPASESFTS